MFAPIDFVQSLESCYELGLDCDALQLRLGLIPLVSVNPEFPLPVFGAYYVIRLVHSTAIFFSLSQSSTAIDFDSSLLVVLGRRAVQLQ